MQPDEPHPHPGRRRGGEPDDTEVDTPPFGTATTGPAPDPGEEPTAAPAAAPRGAPFEIRDRLIELDDLRKRGIISEEEFAAKKSELLNRI
jgi:hypothetical protein